MSAFALVSGTRALADGIASQVALARRFNIRVMLRIGKAKTSMKTPLVTLLRLENAKTAGGVESGLRTLPCAAKISSFGSYATPASRSARRLALAAAGPLPISA
jgi:hypothetical protein